MITAEQIREAVADIAATPMQMPMTRWQEVSSILLGAATEIERLRKLAGDMAEQWAYCEADRCPDDFRFFGPCQLMREGLELRPKTES